MLAAASIDVPLVVITMAGGLALFLLGLEHLSDSLRLLAGHRLRTVLARLTTNRWAGLATGAGVTAIIQSSSATTVLVVGFISSGVMNLAQSASIIIGANVGTTVTAQVIAFDVTRWALGLVAVGFAAGFFSARERRRAIGTLVMGLGLVFFGMGVMTEALEPLRDAPTFLDLLARAENPFLGLLAGTIFTAVVQSSSATTAIVIVLAGQGLVTLPAGIVLVIGANVGTAVTALLAAIGKPREALRAAVVHALFNVLGAVLWIGLVEVLAGFVEALAGGTPRQIANAHTLFNVVNAVVFIGFTDRLARVATAVVPDRPDPAEALIAARHLDTDLIATPSLALARSRLEVVRMATRARRMLAEAVPAAIDGPGIRLQEIEEMDDEVDALHGQIVKYLGRVGERRLSETTTVELIDLMDATNAIEAIGDVVETNIVQIGHSRIEQQVVVGESTRHHIIAMHELVLDSFDLIIQMLEGPDPTAGTEVRRRKQQIKVLEHQALEHQAERLTADAPRRRASYRVEIDLVINLRRVHSLLQRVARTALPIEIRAGDDAP